MILDKFCGYMKHCVSFTVVLAFAVAMGNQVGNVKPGMTAVSPPANQEVQQAAMNIDAVVPAFRPPVSPFTFFRLPGFVPVLPEGFNPLLKPNLFFNGDDPLAGIGG
jgi:hypothetical protein